MVQDPGSSLPGDKYAGAGVPWLVPSMMQASSWPSAVQANSMADNPSIRTWLHVVLVPSDSGSRLEADEQIERARVDLRCNLRA